MRSERLLVSMKNYIGDAVMSEPMISAVEQLYARVEINAGSPVDQVLWQPALRHFFSTPKPKRPWDVVKHARQLRDRSFDSAILVNRSFRSALTVRLAGIRTRVGHDTEKRGALLTKALPYDRDRFEVLSHFDLASAIGVEATPRMPCLSITDEERIEGHALAAGAAIGIQAGARWPGKQIPIDVSIEIARSLIIPGQTVVLLGGIEETESVNKVAEALNGGFVNLVNRTSIRETLGVLAHLQAMIGGDTGLMHLAAGIGCATITVFGPTAHQKWGHDYPPHRVLRAPEGNMSLVRSAEVIDAVQGVLRNA